MQFADYSRWSIYLNRKEKQLKNKTLKNDYISTNTKRKNYK